MRAYQETKCQLRMRRSSQTVCTVSHHHSDNNPCFTDNKTAWGEFCSVMPMCVDHVCVASGERWPLLIDPQLQGIKWIKSRHGSGLKVVSLGQRG